MAHKKGGGSSTNGRDSNAQRLGVKAFAGELITGGSIIMRQRGTRSSRASTWASARTTRSLPRSPAGSSSRTAATAAALPRSNRSQQSKRTRTKEEATETPWPLLLFSSPDKEPHKPKRPVPLRVRALLRLNLDGARPGFLVLVLQGLVEHLVHDSLDIGEEKAVSRLAHGHLGTGVAQRGGNLVPTVDG